MISEIQKVLCACYLYAPEDTETRDVMEAELSANPLTDLDYRDIYEAMVGCRQDGAPFGKTENTLESLGIYQRLNAEEKYQRHAFVDVLTFTTSWVHWRYYLDQWREHCQRFQLVKLAGKIGDNYEDPEYCLKLADDMKHYSETFGGNIEAKHVSDVLIDVMTDIESPVEHDREFATGWSDLDHAIGGGFQRGHLTIIAARPGVGKTSFAINVASQMAPRCLFVSLEMKVDDLAKRMICIESGISSHQLKQSENSEKVSDACRTVAEKDVRIVHESRLTVADIRGLISMYRPEILVVDYLTLLTHENRNLPRYEQVGDFSRGLRNISIQANIPVVALAQLRRDVEQGNRRPRLSDLRESGNIEQDADLVIMLHNSEPEVAGPVSTSVIIAKNRHGQRRTIPMVFMGSTFSFEPEAPARHNEFDDLG